MKAHTLPESCRQPHENVPASVNNLDSLPSSAARVFLVFVERRLKLAQSLGRQKLKHCNVVWICDAGVYGAETGARRDMKGICVISVRAKLGPTGSHHMMASLVNYKLPTAILLFQPVWCRVCRDPTTS